ncbi:hypothetical protein BD309DRAFT_737743 [Dichomitus squalens]|nr:hypothetical protein BD309DRAFT_737743 [Dichomitus squalens]
MGGMLSPRWRVLGPAVSATTTTTVFASTMLMSRVTRVPLWLQGGIAYGYLDSQPFRFGVSAITAPVAHYISWTLPRFTSP